MKILFETHAAHTINKAQRLTSDAQEFISHHPDVKSLSVVKGRVQKISIPLTSDKYQIILPGNKLLTSVMRMTKRFGKDAINNAIQPIAVAAEAKSQHFVAVINHDGSTKRIK